MRNAATNPNCFRGLKITIVLIANMPLRVLHIIAIVFLLTSSAAARPMVLVHYMPWFAAPPASTSWGWHWTMAARDSEKLRDGRREIAAHFYPLIGPYDSTDPHLLECHTLLMKIAGVDGVIADWYGPDDLNDYAFIHTATAALFDHAKRAGLSIAVCYEDQTINAFEKAKKLDARAAHAERVVQWLNENWLNDPAYVKHNDRPLLLVFGPQGLSADQWAAVLGKFDVARRPVLATLHKSIPAADAVFDWPLPQGEGLAAAERFLPNAPKDKLAIPVVFPRFIDYYAQANVRESYGRIEDDNGATFTRLFNLATAADVPFVQIATWNDFGEGTQIEPTVELGYRDLEVIQRWRKRVDPAFPFSSDDLRLPAKIYDLRKLRVQDAATQKRLDAAVEYLRAGKPADAAKQL